VYAGKSTACYSCHQTDYASTAAPAPPHAAAGFPTTCQTCHNTSSFAGATFNHATTPFPLTGAHLAVACANCHGDGVYVGKSTACYSCHQADYTASTTQPPHAASGFPTTCQTCHNTTTFAGATFNHANTLFPLTGAHLSVACANCHGDGVYVGKSTACYSCHQTDYTTAVDPNHPGAGIATTCQTCHNTTAWAGARINHDTPYFRIYSGKHLARWDQCADCHNVPSNYAQFTCFTCHGKSSTDSNHSGVSGYQYVSASCYSCHRNV
jgi:DnaJ-class molecular chaperone